jgi:hypothetical protein
MRQQLGDATGRLRGQALERVAQVRIGIVPVQARLVHQAHDRRGTFARSK